MDRNTPHERNKIDLLTPEQQPMEEVPVRLSFRLHNVWFWNASSVWLRGCSCHPLLSQRVDPILSAKLHKLFCSVHQPGWRIW
ncbi:hypothetical protein MGYG_04456 [Nannizzia gypsea CBS 118893]|uniref:Uncharacterized protein n=1 Tax=Arthroderma gypseum (strain ATCC MYA-4604 / CBS 118893) TaxID=535722 RepID=E4UT53_ARTGP|nr:hypothetical protein MGYG_04456 [Nannizzia gypsea CBS 118893]EFR01449.1 hypothetical protein MGYG_04456 [Nannizzia gypsea CBS 118893]